MVVLSYRVAWPLLRSSERKVFGTAKNKSDRFFGLESAPWSSYIEARESSLVVGRVTLLEASQLVPPVVFAPEPSHGNISQLISLFASEGYHSGHRMSRAGWCDSNTLDLYLGGIQLKLGWNSGLFLQPIQERAGVVCRLGHDRFLPSPFPFIIQSSYHRCYYTARTDRS
jgi:hypothetical protein